MNRGPEYTRQFLTQTCQSNRKESIRLKGKRKRVKTSCTAIIVKRNIIVKIVVGKYELPVLKREKSRNRSNEDNKDKEDSEFVFSIDIGNQDQWIIDSGSSQHVTNNYRLLYYKVQIKEVMEMENERAPDNPYQKSIWLSNMIDAWRIFPRAFLSVYIFLLYYATMWFMDLPDPTLEQSGLISIIVGAGAAWFGLYAGTAKDKINSK